jgi:transposase
MINFPANTRIWIAAGVSDLLRGFTALSAPVQTALNEDPLSSHVLVFRGLHGDLIRILWFDGDGFVCSLSVCGRVVWPKAESGTVALTRAQLPMLHEGIDLRRPTSTSISPLAI